VVALTRELAATGVHSKSWVGKREQALGGHVLSRGAVYHLLANPVYRGVIRHGKLLYAGAHPSIIDERTWDAVQAQLAQNAPKSPAAPKVGEGALLKGLLVDDLNNCMQPIHTRRGERRYHYYVTASLVHGDDREVGSLSRIGAGTLDAVVLDRVAGLLRPAWRAGAPVEARVREALSKVMLGAAKIGLMLHAQSCRPNVEGGVLKVDDLVEVEIPIRLKHRQGATLITPHDRRMAGTAAPDRALVRAVSQTRNWRRRLEAGEVASTLELASREGLCNRHAGRILPLAYLAPDLVTMILEGLQPRAMTLQALTAKPLPRSWADQRRLVTSFS
jgi:hypothetical protein